MSPCRHRASQNMYRTHQSQRTDHNMRRSQCRMAQVARKKVASLCHHTVAQPLIEQITRPDLVLRVGKPCGLCHGYTKRPVHLAQTKQREWDMKPSKVIAWFYHSPARSRDRASDPRAVSVLMWKNLIGGRACQPRRGHESEVS